MKKLASLILTGALAINSGCATIPLREKNQEFDSTKKYFQEYAPHFKKYCDKIKYLEKNEFVLPNEVFDAYITAVSALPVYNGSAVGLYIEDSHLDTNKKQKMFYRNIKKNGYSNDDIRMFYDILTTRGNIIFKEDAVDDTFLASLLHERVHREHDKIINSQPAASGYTLDKILVNTILNSEYRKSHNFRINPVIIFSLATTPEELFAYLADGTLGRDVEEILKNEYPETYKIFDDVRKKALVNKSSNPYCSEVTEK